MKTFLWNCIKFLRSPELVCCFQKICGLKPIADENDQNDRNAEVNETANSHWMSWGNSSDAAELITNKDELIKQSMQNNVKYKVYNKFLYYLFHIGAFLGNEEFIACFYAFTFWNVDAFIVRRFVNMWMAMMYIGQSLKDIICWPRPSSPPVVKLERRYVLEYGLPSTHAMAAFALSFTLWQLGVDRHGWSEFVFCAICVVWTSLTSLSRLYVGMHSCLDVIMGLGLAFILCPSLLRLFGVIEEWTMRDNYAPFVWTLFMFLLTYTYPSLTHFTSTRADTFATLACSFSMPFCCRFGVYLGIYRNILPNEVSQSILLSFWYGFARMLVGMPIAIGLQQATRYIVYNITCRLWGLDRSPQARYRNRERTGVEVAYIFSQYIAIMIAVTLACPILYQYLSIDRPCLNEM